MTGTMWVLGSGYVRYDHDTRQIELYGSYSGVCGIETVTITELNHMRFVCELLSDARHGNTACTTGFHITKQVPSVLTISGKTVKIDIAADLHDLTTAIYAIEANNVEKDIHELMDGTYAGGD